MLYPSPGLQRFAQLTGTHVRGMCEFNGRLFVYTDQFYEIFSDGTFSPGQSFVPDDGLPVTMEANSGGQLLICGGGQVYLYPLTAGAVTGPPPPATVNNIVNLGSYGPSQLGGLIGQGYLFIQSATPFPSYTVGTTLYLESLTVHPELNGSTVQLIGGGGLTANPNYITTTMPARYSTYFASATESGTVSTAPGGTVTVGTLSGFISRVAFLDGYFLALVANTATFYYSNLEDGTKWNAANNAIVSEFPENVTAMITNLRELWIFSPKRALVYYDSGDLLTPFQPIPGAYVEHGCNAPWSPTRLDNSIFWLGSDERGRNVAWRNQGYTPVRISTHGVESIWKTYPTLSDAIGYATSRTGHGWWHLYFPSANASWRYDTTTNMWHETAFLNADGSLGAHRTRTHVYAFEKNLVGDISTGSIYNLTETVSYDDVPDAPQNPIKRLRRAPHVITEHEWIFHRRMRVLLESGLGPTPPFTGPAQGVMNILLTDPNGVQWVANIQDGGTWESAVYATWAPTGGTPVTVAPFADLAYFPYQAVVYALGVDTSGRPTLTMLGPPAGLSGYITELPLQSYPGGLQTRLSVVFGQLQIDPPQAAPREPRMMLRWSDDGAQTWTNEYVCGAGFAGDFRKRVEWRRLGRSRDRVYEVSTTDIIPWRVVDAYLDAVPGYDQPVDRYATQIRKMA